MYSLNYFTYPLSGSMDHSVHSYNLVETKFVFLKLLSIKFYVNIHDSQGTISYAFMDSLTFCLVQSQSKKKKSFFTNSLIHKRVPEKPWTLVPCDRWMNPCSISKPVLFLLLSLLGQTSLLKNYNEFSSKHFQQQLMTKFILIQSE